MLYSCIKILTVLTLILCISIVSIKRFVYFRPSNLTFVSDEHYMNVHYKHLSGLMVNNDMKKLILILPDIKDNMTFYHNKIKMFQDMNYDCAIYNYTGFGTTSGVPSEGKLLKDCKEMVISLLSSYNIDEIVLYGKGAGAFCAIMTAIDFGITKIILDEPLRSIKDRLPKFLPKFIFNEFNVENNIYFYKGQILCNSEYKFITDNLIEYVEDINALNVKEFLDN